MHRICLKDSAFPHRQSDGLVKAKRSLSMLGWLCLTFSASSGVSADPLVEQSAASTVHWAYASYFGTGSYRMNESQSVFVINTAPLLKEGYVAWPDLDDEHSRYTVRVPVTAGLASIDFGDVPGFLDPDNFSLAGIGIGADIDIPLSDHWSVRPNAQITRGRVLGTPESAWTYRADIRARYRFDLGRVQTNLIAATGSVGYKPNSGKGDNFVFTEFGAELAIPMGWGSANNDPSLLIPSVKYTQLPVGMQVTQEAGVVDKTANLIDIGLAFARARRPLRWWIIEVDRVGLAVSASSTSELVGIKLVVESMYEP